MKMFVVNLLLAVVWSLMIEDLTIATLFVGFVCGFVLLWFLRPLLGETVYFQKVPQVIRFMGFLVKELVVANLKLAWHIITPRNTFRPGVIAIELDPMTDLEAALLANFVTITPMSFSVDLSSDRKVLYVHMMDIKDVAEAKRSIKEQYEKLLLEVLR
jgi:multicomponent Na+:H+ antiporter subunit E